MSEWSVWKKANSSVCRMNNILEYLWSGDFGVAIFILGFVVLAFLTVLPIYLGLKSAFKAIGLIARK